jgi:hypothetical protein
VVIALRCLFLGHDDIMVRAPERLYLRCEHCARETAGWTVSGSPKLRKGQRGMGSRAIAGRQHDDEPWLTTLMRMDYGSTDRLREGRP